MKLIVVLLFVTLTIFLVVYALGLREWLKSKPSMAGFYRSVEPVERILFKKSSTILFARLKQVTGFVLAMLMTFGQLDLTPFFPLLPESYRGLAMILINCVPLTITLVGMADEYLRRTTKLPLEVVALPQAELDKPKVAEAVAALAAVKEEAVATIKREGEA